MVHVHINYVLRINCFKSTCTYIILTTSVSQGKPVSLMIITCDGSVMTPGTFSCGSELGLPVKDLM